MGVCAVAVLSAPPVDAPALAWPESASARIATLAANIDKLAVLVVLLSKFIFKGSNRLEEYRGFTYCSGKD